MADARDGVAETNTIGASLGIPAPEVEAWTRALLFTQPALDYQL